MFFLVLTFKDATKSLRYMETLSLCILNEQEIWITETGAKSRQTGVLCVINRCPEFCIILYSNEKNTSPMTVSTAAASSLAANAAGGGVGTVTNLEDSFWHKVTLKKNAGIPIRL